MPKNFRAIPKRTPWMEREFKEFKRPVKRFLANSTTNFALI